MDNQIRIQQIEQRTKRRSRFATHAVFFVGFALFTIIFLLEPSMWRNFMTLPNTGDLVLIAAIWAVIFAAHAARFWVEEAGDRVIGRLTEAEKPKRSLDRLLLDDEGELLAETEPERRHEKS